MDTKFFCRTCALLHEQSAIPKAYVDINRWWQHNGNACETRERIRLRLEHDT